MRRVDNVDPEDLNEILDKKAGERDISSFLKKNPDLVYWTFCRTGGHVNYVFSEFTIGNQFKADLVVLHTHSGGFEAHFIELEPVRDTIFNKNNTPSKKLAIAIRQIDDWKEYIKTNEWNLRKDLVRWAIKKDLLNKKDKDHDPSNYAKEILTDPSVGLFFTFYIIIGLRKNLTKEKRLLKNRYRENHGIDIGSYDRFVDTAMTRQKTIANSLHLTTSS